MLLRKRNENEEIGVNLFYSFNKDNWLFFCHLRGVSKNSGCDIIYHIEKLIRTKTEKRMGKQMRGYRESENRKLKFYKTIKKIAKGEKGGEEEFYQLYVKLIFSAA